jgi:hypothetical protein
MNFADTHWSIILQLHFDSLFKTQNILVSYKMVEPPKAVRSLDEHKSKYWWVDENNTTPLSPGAC